MKFCWYILWNLLFPIMCLFTQLSAFPRCECQVSHSTNFHRGVRLRFYAKHSYGHSICVIGLIFLTGDVTNSGLHTAFFTFSIHSIPDSYWDLSHYLKLNLCMYFEKQSSEKNGFKVFTIFNFKYE